jgi:DNA-binding NtrC family response regulator
VELPPHIIITSKDETLTLLAREAAAQRWQVRTLTDIPSVPWLPNWPDLRVIVIDDDALPQANRAAAFTRMREWAPRASLIYVASRHSAETEKLARTWGVSYYTSKPLESDRFRDILRAFLESGTAIER